MVLLGRLEEIGQTGFPLPQLPFYPLVLQDVLKMMDNRIIRIGQCREVRVQQVAALVDGQTKEYIEPLPDRESLVVQHLACHEQTVRVRAGTGRINTDIHLERCIHRDDHLTGEPIGVLHQFLVALRIHDGRRIGGILRERVLPAEASLLTDPDEMVSVPLKEVLREKVELLLRSHV